MIAGRFDEGYPVAYTVVLAVVAMVFWGAHKLPPGLLGELAAETSDAQRSPFLVHWSVLPGVVVGIVGIALWIGICHLELEATVAAYLPSFMRPGERVSYNPFDKIHSVEWAWCFIVVRMIGIAVVVPIAEELFWRGFLLRWLIDPEWEKVPLGTYTASSCALVTLFFTLAHPEWIAAATYGLLINGLLYWKRDLWQCIVAHAVSNFLLALYVLQYEQWFLW